MSAFPKKVRHVAGLHLEYFTVINRPVGGNGGNQNTKQLRPAFTVVLLKKKDK